MPKTSLEEAQNNKGNTEGLMTLTPTIIQTYEENKNEQCVW